ncbi:MAG TPA: Rrf2 family transcriptional regulator [Candidatus Omnitrophota bacterium]|nr:Rrf2 family transcriptional regulator [Candidatus Omnitrophota bacterium]HRY86059.1 Rrf2 family transcriptional regulator [Candidatus Omnitrophota bacterium]
MISKKTKYALKAVLMLTEKYASKEPVLIAQIAESESIPKKFLESILLELKNKGLLQSKKGKGGGYLLARSPNQISFGEVIGIFENPFGALPCLNSSAHKRCEECKKGTTCGIHMVMQEVYRTTSSILNITTFQEIHDRMRNTSQEAMYFI